VYDVNIFKFIFIKFKLFSCCQLISTSIIMVNFSNYSCHAFLLWSISPILFMSCIFYYIRIFYYIPPQLKRPISIIFVHYSCYHICQFLNPTTIDLYGQFLQSSFLYHGTIFASQLKLEYGLLFAHH